MNFFGIFMFYILPTIFSFVLVDHLIFKRRKCCDNPDNPDISIFSFLWCVPIFIPIYGSIVTIIVLICDGYFTQRVFPKIKKFDYRIKL